MPTIPLTLRGAEAAQAGAAPAQVRRAAGGDHRDRRSARPGRPVRERRLRRGKERQGFIEGRIAELEGKLSNAQVIDPSSLDAGDGRIVFGATVELEDQASGEQVTYQIVGDDEADIKDGKISVSSPIARALIGKHAGDVIGFQAPAGRREYEVLDVRYV
jgi:transcription elongation factor GreA